MRVKHVDGERQPWSLVHRLPCRFIDKEDIDLGAVDLHDLERPGRCILPRHNLCGLDALCVFALQSDRPPIDAIDARLDRPAVGKRQAFLRAARPDLLDQIRHGRALGPQIYLLDCRYDQSFALGVQHKGILAPAQRSRLDR
jgi:hypothetical protein